MSTLRYWVLHLIALVCIVRAVITPNQIDSTVLEWLAVPHTVEAIIWYIGLLFYGTQAVAVVFIALSFVVTKIERWHGTSGVSQGIEQFFTWLWNHMGVSLVKGFFYLVCGVWLYFIVIVLYAVLQFIPASGIPDFVSERFGSTVGYGFAATLFLDMARNRRWSNRWLRVIVSGKRERLK